MMEVCQKCRGEIENICVGCIEKFLEFLLMTHNKITLIPILRSRTQRFNNYGTTSKLCNVCGDNVGVCINCYLNDISEWLSHGHPGISKIILNRKNELKAFSGRIKLRIS